MRKVQPGSFSKTRRDIGEIGIDYIYESILTLAKNGGESERDKGRNRENRIIGNTLRKI